MEADAPPPLLPDHHLPSHYTHDGSFNHPAHPLRGTVGSPRIRKYPPLHSYNRRSPSSNITLDDRGISNIFNVSTSSSSGVDPLWHHPRQDLPSARNILVELFQRTLPRRNERTSQLLMAFGHFVTRDITRTQFPATTNTQGEVATTERMDIECDLIETRGPFCPQGQKFMEFYRSPRRSDERYDTIDEEGEKDTNEEDTGEPINHASKLFFLVHRSLKTIKTMILNLTK